MRHAPSIPVLLALACAAAGLQLGADALLAPPAFSQTPRPSQAPVSKPGGPQPPAAPPPRATTVPEAGQRAPDIRLVGVILRENQAPVALIETPRPQRQALYRVGDTVGEARIERILEDRAIVRYRGEEVVLRLAGSPSAPTSTPGPRPSGASTEAAPGDPDVNDRLRELARRLRDNPGDAEAIAEMRRLRAGQRSAPVRASDLAQSSAAPDVIAALPVEGGVRVVEAGDEGLLGRLGLLPGDIVRQVNRRAVGAERSLGDALNEAAATGSELQIDLTRDGAPLHQNHRLVR